MAKLKMKMFDIYLLDLDITDTEMSKRLGIDQHTCAKWKKELFYKLETYSNRFREDVEQKAEEIIMKKAGIWQTIVKTFKP